MRIIADTPTLYAPEEGRSMGVTIIPACTIIGENVYRDYQDIGFAEFMDRIAAGDVPTTSQPAIGDVLDVFASCEEDTLVLPIGDGLSGTYQNMLSARSMLEKNDHIHIMDTQTLAGPQRYLVQKAVQLREKGFGIDHIKAELQKCIDSSASFVIPADFNFLRRSGRLTPVAAKLVTALKIAPVLTQTEDMKRITLMCIKRTKKKAIQAIIDHLKAKGVDENYRITVAHGGVIEDARAAVEQLRQHFADSAMEIFPLAPSLVCHGGPGCILIQTIRQ